MVTGLSDNFPIQQKDRLILKVNLFNFIYKNSPAYCWLLFILVKRSIIWESKQCVQMAKYLPHWSNSGASGKNFLPLQKLQVQKHWILTHVFPNIIAHEFIKYPKLAIFGAKLKAISRTHYFGGKFKFTPKTFRINVSLSCLYFALCPSCKVVRLY